MVRFSQPQSWTSNSHDLYVPVAHEGETVGFFKPTYAAQMLETLNEDALLRKALELACYDLVARSGGTREGVSALMQQYLTKAKRPTKGVSAIAFYLTERQQELDLTNDEFVKFCDTFRLSAIELENLCSGQEIEHHQLIPLSRILGMSVEELTHVWKGEGS